MDTRSQTRRRSRVSRQYRIRRASTADIDDVLGLIDGAAAWLREEKTTTQWNKPWPNREQRDKRVHESLATGETWLLFDEDRPIGTVTIKLIGHEELWTEAERRVEAVYLHRLVIDRDYEGAGLGAELINWAGRKGRSRQRGAAWIRIDVWTDNAELHRYYRGQGFQRVAERTTSDKSPSGALFQKPMALAVTADVARIADDEEISLTIPGLHTNRTIIRSLSGVSRQ